MKRSMKHQAVVKGQTIFAETEEELAEKIKAAQSSNGKKADSDSAN